MKRALLILIAVFSLLLFNSCKEDEPEKPIPAIKMITKITSLIGLSKQDAKLQLESWGYTYIRSEEIGENDIFYSFESQSSSSTYNLHERNNKIYLCEYSENLSKTIALDYFEKFSKEGIDYMLDKTYSYEGAAKDIDYQISTFGTHQEFMEYYSLKKADLQSCSEQWDRINERVATKYVVNYESFRAYISYIDKTNAPPSIFKQ